MHQISAKPVWIVFTKLTAQPLRCGRARMAQGFHANRNNFNLVLAQVLDTAHLQIFLGKPGYLNLQVRYCSLGSNSYLSSRTCKSCIWQLLVIASPANPLGSVTSVDELQRIAQVVLQKDPIQGCCLVP